jgi:hypothetical protein
MLLRIGLCRSKFENFKSSGGATPRLLQFREVSSSRGLRIPPPDFNSNWDSIKIPLPALKFADTIEAWLSSPMLFPRRRALFALGSAPFGIRGPYFKWFTGKEMTP